MSAHGVSISPTLQTLRLVLTKAAEQGPANPHSVRLPDEVFQDQPRWRVTLERRTSGLFHPASFCGVPCPISGSAPRRLTRGRPQFADMQGGRDQTRAADYSHRKRPMTGPRRICLIMTSTSRARGALRARPRCGRGSIEGCHMTPPTANVKIGVRHGPDWRDVMGLWEGVANHSPYFHRKCTTAHGVSRPRHPEPPWTPNYNSPVSGRSL